MPSPTLKIQYFSDQDLLLLPVWMEQMAADGLYLKSYGYKNCLHRVVRRKTECRSSSDPSDRTAPLTYAAAPKEKTGFFSRLVLPEREKEQWEAYHWNREFETFTFALYSNCQPNPQFPVSREETCRRVRRLSMFTDLINNLILTALCLVAMGLAFRFLGGWENGPDPGFWPVLISVFLLAYPIPDMVRWFTGNPDPAADGGLIGRDA